MRKKYGFHVVSSGEQAIVYDLEGRARIVEGPQRLFLWREKVEHLRRFTASQTEYLVVKYRNGRVEHIKGPTSMFRIPTIHDTITTKKAITLDAHEVVVVYRHNGDASERTVERYIEYGPKMFVPGSNEWLHKFCWHGVDPNNKTRYIPGSNKFTKLKLIPDQFYYNVDEIRTSDNGLVRIKLMIFHEIVDVDAMLAATDDPIGDIISCICADVTSFTAIRTYAEFVETSCKLNELENYPHLNGMCKGSGIRVTKIVFRGYFAAPKIQANHDEAIDKRTNLQMQFEKEQQIQESKDRELAAERERITLSHKIELEQLKQVQKLSAMSQTHNVQLEKRKFNAEMERKSAEAKAATKHLQDEMEADMNHYRKLKELGVDITEYILHQSGNPEKITKIVNDRSSAPPVVHLYMSRNQTVVE